MSATYTDSIIVNCNRAESVEAQSNNDENFASFTNTLGQGVKLDVGDQVEIQSTYISEIGAGADTIEFKGEVLKDYLGRPITKTFTHIEKTQKYPVLNQKTIYIESPESIRPHNRKGVDFYEEEWVEKTTDPIKLRDNEANILVNYYKNADGHGYMFLPRNGYKYQTDSPYTSPDYLDKGNAYILPRTEQVCSADYHVVDMPKMKTIELGENVEEIYQSSLALTQRYGTQNVDIDYSNQVGGATLKHDNSRYTMYVRTDEKIHPYAWWWNSPIQTRYNEGNRPKSITPWKPIYNACGAVLTAPPNNRGNPSLATFKRYAELKQLSVAAGFNSPSNIAAGITAQLKHTQEPKTISTTANVLFDTGTQTPVSNLLTAELCKPFPVATLIDIASYEGYTDQSKSADWLEPSASLETATGQEIRQDTIRYHNIFNQIYIKRPDLYDAGLQFPDFTLQTHIDDESAPPFISTNLNYTRANLIKMNNFFKVQGYYPELMENSNWGEDYDIRAEDNGSSSAARFIHFMHVPQISTNTDMAQINAWKNAGNFGCDNCTELSKGNASNGFHVRDIDNSTKPFWIKYQTKNSDIYNNGDDLDNLSFGFAVKVAGKIGLVPHTMVRDFSSIIPNKTFMLFDAYGADTTNPFVAPPLYGPTFQYRMYGIDIGTNFGFDSHFNSYGAAMMVGYSGRFSHDYYNQTTTDFEAGGPGDYKVFSEIIRHRYFGANDPLFNFDSVESRFSFSRLHIAETAGQSNYLAGATSIYAPDINGESFKEVYKMNPRDIMWEWTPSLMPYGNSDNALGKARGEVSQEYTASWGGITNNWISTGASGAQTFSVMNPHIEAFKIFDSKSGVFISDMGFDESNWDDGLWGILGFSYSQFNQQLGKGLNYNTRITPENKSKLPYVLTNCDLVNKDVQAYVLSPWGAQFQTTQQSSLLLIEGPNLSSSSSTCFQYPAITQPTTSIILLAENLPRKMKKGAYYAIRSDLIDKPTSISTNGRRLPVMHICDKQYSGGDFYFSSDNVNQFRITIPKVITEIKTEITDPDGSFSRCDDNCAVIYKITKNIVADTDLAAEIEKQNKK
tara:strand:+ start:9225 stop:12446 length:3222 start_codon:yes stop_codon:yes gene_type:complete